MYARDRQPALDGLRGVAIALVLGYHAAPEFMRGGFIGVSVFFTLSGFLIGSHLADEWIATGRLDLSTFWSRRARRLLPAAVMTVGATALAMHARGDFDRDFAQAASSAATYRENWYRLSNGGGYGALFDRASPLDHFWSLAIEEQFYILFPLVLLVVLALVRGSRRWAAAILGGLALVSFLLPAALGAGFERRYLGTDTRIGEILVGVVIALVGVPYIARSKWVPGAAVPALVALVAAAKLVPYGSGWFVAGMLPVSVLTSITLAGCLRTGSVVERCLSVSPLAGLGVISYSLYLVHWPVLVLSGASSPRAVMTAVAVSVAISIVLHRLVERPAMRLLPLGRRTLVGFAAATVVVGTSVLALAPAANRDVLAELQFVADRNGADGRPDDGAVVTAFDPLPLSSSPPATSPPASAVQSESTVPPQSTVPPHSTVPPQSTVPPHSTVPAPAADEVHPATTTEPVRPPPTLGFIGDSVALSLGLAASSQKDPTLYRPAKWSVELGCGLARFESTSAIELDCADPVDRVGALVPGSIDVAVVVSCQWELLDRRIPGHDHKLDITAPEFQDYVYSEYLRVADALVASGVDKVLWGICAPMSQVVGVDGLPRRYVASRSTERWQALAAVVRRVADARPAVETIDLGRIVEGHVDDATMRPDGSHFEWKRDVGVAAAFNALLRCALLSDCAPSDDSSAIR